MTTLVRRSSTVSVCGWCAMVPLTGADHSRCPGDGKWSCACARADHVANDTVMEYQAKYLQVHIDDIREFHQDGTPIRAGTETPVGFEPVRRRRQVIRENGANKPFPDVAASRSSGSQETAPKTSAVSASQRAAEAERALAAFTGHGRVGKL